MVERITITIKKDILRKIDKAVNGKNARSRSHAIEDLLLRAMSKTDIHTAVIMAGGEGVKLRPITYEIPKTLIPIKGRPILEHQINLLRKYDIRNILLSVNHMRDKIREYFGDGSKFGVNIEYVIEDEPLGTAGSLSLIKNRIKSTFLMLNVDTLVNLDVPAMYEFHKKENRLATVLLATTDNPSEFGVVKMRGNKILEFIEKPRKAMSNLINGGFYVFEPEVMDMIPKRKFMTEELFIRLAKKNQLSGFVHDGDIFDVGTPRGYEMAIRKWNT